MSAARSPTPVRHIAGTGIVAARLLAFGPVLAVLVAACAPAGGLLGPPSGTTPLPTTAALRVAVQRAKAAFDSAARRGDVAELAALFTPGAVVVAGRDTLRGFEAVAEWFASARPSAIGGSVEFRPNRTEWCTDGTWESGGSLMLVVHAAEGAPDSSQPAYRVRWAVDADGRARIRYAALARQGSPPVRLSVPTCAPNLDAAHFARRRVAFTLGGPVALFGQGLLAHWEQVLEPRGFNPEWTPSWKRSKGRASESHDALVAAARLRFWTALSAEVLASPLARRMEVRAANPVTGNVAWLWNDSRWAAILLGGEWRRFRFAAGPLVVRSERRLWNHVIRRPDGTGYVLPISEDVTWNETVVGMLAQGAVTVPISSRTFVELQARWKHARGHTPPFTHFEAAAFDLVGWSVGLAAGIAP